MDVQWLEQAAKEASKVLPHAAARAQLQKIVERLGSSTTGRWPEDLDIRSLYSYRGLYELRQKGGAIGKIAVRVFFGVIGRTVYILGVTKKQSEKGTEWIYQKCALRLARVSASLSQSGKR
jgi:hypothetical protein